MQRQADDIREGAVQFFDVDRRAPLGRICTGLAHRLTRRDIGVDLGCAHRGKAHGRLRRVGIRLPADDPCDPRDHRMRTSLEQREHAARVRGILRLAEGHIAQHDRGIRPEHGVVRIFLFDLACLRQRVPDHGIARMRAALCLIDGGRDRNELRPDLVQERAAARRCRCKYKHNPSPTRPRRGKKRHRNCVGVSHKFLYSI